MELDPVYAAKLAANVYEVKSITTREIFVARYKSDMDFPEHYDSSKPGFSTGVTGALVFLKKSHVMACLARGKGKYAGQAFVAIMGTASLYDGLTDANTGIRSSHTGMPVHQGFYYAFDSMLGDLRMFINSLGNIQTIHCVGHSLGGAVATLAADWIKANHLSRTVKLYTFGSPRVGLEMFASKFTSRLSEANSIFRVYHQTDPVAMVPTWPFMHVPLFGTDYLMYSPVAVAPPWKYHFMEHYIDSVTQAKTWSAMQNNRPKSYPASVVEKWLESSWKERLTLGALEMLNAALVYVIKKIVQVTSIQLNIGLGTTFTLLDRLAIFLAKSAEVAKDVSIWVLHLIRKMANLIGLTIKEGQDLTIAFVRYVFLRLHHKISDMIREVGYRIG